MQKIKILVPTDFSALSEVAVRYAAELATELGAGLLLLHVVHFETSRAAASMKKSQVENAMEEISQQKCGELENQLKTAYPGLTVSYKVVTGYPVEDVVEKAAVDNNADFIIMGTKGASGLKRLLMGSNATAVIAKSSVPVIVVPEHAVYKGIKNIVYASALTNLVGDAGVIIPFARVFNAHLHICHIKGMQSTESTTEADIIKEVTGKYAYNKLSAHIVASNNLPVSIDRFILDYKADMLAMFTHEPTLYEKLFGKSITREMAFHTWVPLLAVKFE